LEEILSLRVARTLTNDYTLRNDKKFYQVLEQQPVRVKPGDKIEVEQRLDGSMRLRFKGVYLNAKAIAQRPYSGLLKTQPSRTKQRDPARPRAVRKTNPSWRSFVVSGKPQQWQPTASTPAWK
jgi:hypothetical protein